MSRQPFRFGLIKKIIAFGIIVFVLDLAIGGLLRILYFRQSSGFLFRRTWTIEKTTASLIVFGDSRAAHSYVPQSFENILDLEFYNAGCEGVGIEYHEAVLRAILIRHRPQFIILDLSPAEFGRPDNSRARLSVLFPYLRRHPEIRTILRFFGPFDKIKLLSQIYPFNSNIISIFIGNLSFNKKRRANLQGYVPLDGQWNEPIRNIEIFPEIDLQEDALASFHNFLSLTKAHGVPTIVIVSPVYQKWTRATRTMSLAKEICREMKTVFLDFSQAEEFVNYREYFADEFHFNQKGASVFSTEMAKQIGRILKIKKISLPTQ